MAWSPSKPMLDLNSLPDLITSSPSQTATPTPSRPTSSIPSPTHVWDPLISSASHLLHDLQDHIHLDLRKRDDIEKRQGGVGATNIVAVVTQPTQMPSVTVYDMKSGPLRTFTQAFSLPLVPFPAPQAGSVGMGTIQGAIGVVKTITKREIQTQTSVLPGQVLTIRGRGVTMV